MYTKYITSMSLVIFFVGVCLHYSLTVYTQMLPKHNMKLLTILFSHIISINPQNYNLFISSTHQQLWQHILHIITCSVLQRTHQKLKCHSQSSISNNETGYVETVDWQYLTFKNRASYIYRTGVPLPSRCCILYIFF